MPTLKLVPDAVTTLRRLQSRSTEGREAVDELRRWAESRRPRSSMVTGFAHRPSGDLPDDLRRRTGAALGARHRYDDAQVGACAAAAMTVERSGMWSLLAFDPTPEATAPVQRSRVQRIIDSRLGTDIDRALIGTSLEHPENLRRLAQQVVPGLRSACDRSPEDALRVDVLLDFGAELARVLPGVSRRRLGPSADLPAARWAMPDLFRQAAEAADDLFPDHAFEQVKNDVELLCRYDLAHVVIPPSAHRAGLAARRRLDIASSILGPEAAKTFLRYAAHRALPPLKRALGNDPSSQGPVPGSTTGPPASGYAHMPVPSFHERAGQFSRALDQTQALDLLHMSIDDLTALFRIENRGAQNRAAHRFEDDPGLR